MYRDAVYAHIVYLEPPTGSLSWYRIHPHWDPLGGPGPTCPPSLCIMTCDLPVSQLVMHYDSFPALFSLIVYSLPQSGRRFSQVCLGVPSFQTLYLFDLLHIHFNRSAHLFGSYYGEGASSFEVISIVRIPVRTHGAAANQTMRPRFDLPF